MAHKVRIWRQLTPIQAVMDRPDGRWGDADQMPRRFDRAGVTALLDTAGLTTTRAHGIRLFSDLVPSALVDSDADRAAMLDLERDKPWLADIGDKGEAKESMIELLAKVVRVSMETVAITEAMRALDRAEVSVASDA